MFHKKLFSRIFNMTFGHKINKGEIIIKDDKILKALMERQYQPVLIDIIIFVAQTYGIVMTEAWRKERHPGDVHTRCRAIDSRSWCYPDQKAYRIMDEINNKWEYDFDRPEKQCSITHKVKTGGFHFHIQVHPNTRRRA